jgi:hypothetical protein
MAMATAIGMGMGVLESGALGSVMMQRRMGVRLLFDCITTLIGNRCDYRYALDLGCIGLHGDMWVWKDGAVALFVGILFLVLRKQSIGGLLSVLAWWFLAKYRPWQAVLIHLVLRVWMGLPAAFVGKTYK